jgi:hypothetical protein
MLQRQDTQPLGSRSPFFASSIIDRKRQMTLRSIECQLETNFDEFSTWSDAEPVPGGVVRVSVLVAPRGILLVVHMANDRHGNKNDGCADN